MNIRTAAFALILVAAMRGLFPARLSAQAFSAHAIASRSEVGLVYTYVRSSVTNGTSGSGNFSLSGAAATGAYRVRPRLSAVVDLGGTHVNGIQDTGLSLTELTYLFGARYALPASPRVKPFAQALLGGVHATGSLYPPNPYTAGGADTFAMTLGGGVDYTVNPVISLRAQGDYFLTELPNGGNNRQNNLRLGLGFVVHFGAR